MHDGAMIEEVARIKRRVTHELEDRAVHLRAAGLGDDVGKTRSPTANLGGHDAGTGVDLLDGIDVKIREGGATQFRIGSIEAVHGKHRGRAALPVHRKLLREVDRPVGVGHGPCGEQEQLAEVSLVQWQPGNLATGKLLAATGGFNCARPA